ncbi:hypothetical protein SLEP1_g54625 [Rubroshorea leprosula]|uniref:Uncharacterized protein n=1 Tax=Rubroshorea leprosula TaxID=152421 RepID=A0AAV5ME45_9ROSI|nr:hypothetical protein SLEP1_g54625 [Rubroshorea leprosula]
MLLKGFRCVVGDGSQVGFWRHIWVGDRSLRDLCPRLFQLAVNKKGMVREMGKWGNGRGKGGSGIWSGDGGEWGVDRMRECCGWCWVGYRLRKAWRIPNSGCMIWKVDIW